MKGVALVVMVVIFLAGLGSGNPPLKEPKQYEQFCNDLKVAGNGTIDMSTSMLDKRIAMEYFNALSGQGLIEMNLERVYSQVASKVIRNVSLGNGTKPSKLNLFENSQVTYSGTIPLVSEKYLHSKEFYGGIGATIAEKFSVNQLEQDQKTSFGSTETATGAHLIGVDTKGAFNGSWQTDSSWHKIFYKDIKSHQSFSGKFEIDRQIKLHEEDTHVSSLEVIKMSSLANVKPGDVVTYDYQVKNTGLSTISNLALIDSDLGQIKLDDTMLMPGQTTSGKANYSVKEEGLLVGLKESTATVTGSDRFGKEVRASTKSKLDTGATYYPQGILNSGGRGMKNYLFFQEPFNLSNGNLTLYAVGVNMTLSRHPAPACPYKGWPKPNALSELLFGVTDGQSSAWQNLSLAKGKYSGSQVYGSADGNSTQGPCVIWNSTYGGLSPNGGFNCTRNPGYDTFDLKLTLMNLGLDEGVSIDSYQRINKSTEQVESTEEWRQIGHQEIPEARINKAVIRPFVVVSNMNTTMGGNISWSKIIAAQ
jgi:hypothetical protein